MITALRPKFWVNLTNCYRFSRIAITDVKLIRVEGTTLYVSGLDALDGSPVLDIKVAKNDWYY